MQDNVFKNLGKMLGKSIEEMNAGAKAEGVRNFVSETVQTARSRLSAFRDKSTLGQRLNTTIHWPAEETRAETDEQYARQLADVKAFYADAKRSIIEQIESGKKEVSVPVDAIAMTRFDKNERYELCRPDGEFVYLWHSLVEWGKSEQLDIHLLARSMTPLSLVIIAKPVRDAGTVDQHWF